MSTDTIKKRIAMLSEEIEVIHADALARTKPLAAEVNRLTSALQVIEEFGIGAPQLGPPSKTMRSLILEEFQKSPGVSFTRVDLVSRFRGYGYEVNEQTVGSTLSNMTREGVLVKDEANRYSLRMEEAPDSEL